MTPRSESSTTRCAHSARSAALAAARDAAAPGAAAGRGAQIRSAVARFNFEDFDDRSASAASATSSARCSAAARRADRRRAPARTGARPGRRGAARDSVSHRRARRQGADRARGERGVPDLSRQRRRAGAKIQTCPECQGRGTISFGQGGFAVQRPCPMCLGQGHGAERALPDVQRRRRGARAEEDDDHRAAGRRHRHEDPAQGAGRPRHAQRSAGRSAHHVPGRARSLLQARGTRPHRAGADQHRAGDARLEDQREDARREKGRDQDSAGHAERENDFACAVRASRRTTARAT